MASETVQSGGELGVGEIEKDKEEGIGDEDGLEPVEGKRAWIVVFGSFWMHFVVIGFLYSFSVFVLPYQDKFGIGRADVSLIYMVEILLMFSMGLPAGRLSDAFGARIVLAFGSFCWALGLFLASFATEYWHVMMSQGVLTGLGMAGTYWPGVTVVPQWFERRRATALGVAVVGAGIGNFVWGLLIETFIKDFGVGTTLQIVSGMGFALLVVATLCMKRRLPNAKKGGILGDSSILKERLFHLILLSGFFFQFGYHGPFVFLAAFAEDNGIDSSIAAICVGLLGIGSAVGRVALGFVADAFGRMRSFQGTLFFTGVSLALWPLCVDPVSLGIFAFCFGFFSGGFIALVPVVVAEYYGTEKLGSVMGLVSLGLIPGSIGGPPMIGAIYDDTGSFLIGAIVSAVVVFIAVGFMLPMPLDGEAYRLKREQRQEEKTQTEDELI